MIIHRICILISVLLLFSGGLSGQSETRTLPTSCPFNVVAAISHPSCHDGDDGYVELQVVNAVPPVSVSWIELDGSQTSSTDAAFLGAGIHRAEITDGTGCTDTVSIQLDNPPEIVTVSLFRENVRCFGQGDGIIDLEPSDPSKVRAYYINGQEMAIPANTNRPRFSNLHPGSYLVAIEDINGCIKEDFAEITEPEPLEVEASKTPTTCPDGNDGAMSISVTGGVGGYLYSLNGVDYEQEGTFEQLEPKEYELYVKDANDCVKSRTFVINAPPEPEVTFEKEDVTCPGGENASFIVIIETVGLDPAAGFEYSLDGDNYQQSNQFENLKAGVYDVYSKSPKSCVTVRTVVVEEPQEPVIEFEKEDVTCPGGNDAQFIVIIETVGLQADDEYEYSLDGVEYQSDSLFENLSSGIYELRARNQHQCIATASVVIDEPDEPKMSFEKEDVTCPGGNDAQFIVIIETVGMQADDNYEYSLDGNFYQPDSLFEDLSAGVYQVYARNPSFCVSSSVVVISEPGEPSIEIGRQDISCYGAGNGRISISVNGNSSYSYSLNGNIYQGEGLFDGLNQGSYTVYVRDNNGCIFTDTSLISQPDSLENTFTTGYATCGYANGWVASQVKGGTAPYNYIWNTGAQTAVVSGLIGGNYRLTISDQNGCEYTDSLFLVNQESPLLRAVCTNASCFGKKDGRIDLDIEAYGSVMEVHWSNGAQTEDVEGLEAGDYSVTVIDENYCSASEQVTITEPEELFAEGQVEKVGNTGAISLEVSGGTQPYFYSWSNGANVATLQDLAPGDYSVTISDENQCTTVSSFTLLPAQRPLADDLNIYPVPTTTDVNIKFDLAKTESVKIELLDELGRLMVSMPEVPVLHDLITLDLDRAAAGAYFLRIYLDGEVIVKRVVKVDR